MSSYEPSSGLTASLWLSLYDYSLIHPIVAAIDNYHDSLSRVSSRVSSRASSRVSLVEILYHIVCLQVVN